MSSSVSAIGVAPIQPVPPIFFRPPEDALAPVAAASADDAGSNAADMLYRRGPQWPAGPLTYANPAAAGAAADPMAPQSEPSDAIFDPDAALSWASKAAEVERVDPAPHRTAAPLAAQPRERTQPPLQGGYEIDRKPEWLAEKGATPVRDTPDALEAVGGEAMFAQELLDQVLKNKALYPADKIAVPVRSPAAGREAPAVEAEPRRPAVPHVEAQLVFAGPAEDTVWQIDRRTIAGAGEAGRADSPPAMSDEAILAATDNGGTRPTGTPATDSAPADPLEVAPPSVEKRSYDPFAQAALGTGGPQAQAAALAQAAYAMVSRVSGDTPAAIDAVKLA